MERRHPLERRKTSDVDQMIHGRRFSRPGLRSTTWDCTCIEKVINHLLSTFMQQKKFPCWVVWKKNKIKSVQIVIEMKKYWENTNIHLIGEVFYEINEIKYHHTNSIDINTIEIALIWFLSWYLFKKITLYRIDALFYCYCIVNIRVTIDGNKYNTDR